MKAKKELTREMNGDIETVKYHIIENVTIQEEILEYCQDRLDDDYESAYSEGIYGDFEGEVYKIDINTFILKLEDAITYDSYEENKDKFNQWISDLTKYRDYQIYK
jgi:hypothetical protein